MSDSNIYTSGAYLQENPTYHVEDSPWKAEKILRIIEDNKLHPQTVCEIGCGAGEILRQLQQQLPDQTKYLGYDISPQAIELCKQRENQRLQCKCEDLLAVDTPLYDLLLCIDVFEHVDDYIGFLRQLYPRATYHIFHIPLDLSALSVARSHIMQARAHTGHLHYFTKDTALATLDYCGYDVVDYFYTYIGEKGHLLFKIRVLSWFTSAFSVINHDLAVRLFGTASLLVLTKQRPVTS